ncbi:hypothetical protein [Nostoc sp. ATCC 53789]|uniref:hypothetical protein n=1 Tax=Nostoc sp. ATCC 53789 TaxID=76335 RepID=UPI000DECFDAD|nr:hypothetical protein [Nostoc sp. ATCC 53789]QHG20496.1 hypothetical protein GJB62_31765 [Nostoc sp. ATCC 53789]RCJ19251.1 hypothetical protein A6V25_27250 [Nostoc sp. ATCC 53789]
MELNKSLKAIIAASILTIAFNIFSESAQAGFGQASSPAINEEPEDLFSFTIDTSIEDIDPDLNIGIFPNAIINGLYQVGENSAFPRDIFFTTGLLKSSVIEDPEKLRILNNQPSNFSTFGGEFVNQAVKYEARLEDASGENFINFEFYSPFTDPNSLSVFNLENLANFLNSDGIVIFPRNLSGLNSELANDSNGFNFIPASDSVTQVPEPSFATGLLSVGVLSAFFGLKRQKHQLN